MEQQSLTKRIKNRMNARSSHQVVEERYDEGHTLLSRQYHWVCPMCLIIYVVLQLLIGLQSGLGDTKTGDMEVGTRAYYFYNGGATSFIVSAVQQAVKIFECRLQPGRRRSAEAIYFAVFTVNIIAASSFLLTFLMNYGGVCTDVFGVVSNTSQWAEWLVTVPLMVYMTLAIEDKERLNKRDIIILVVFVLAIAFGFLLNFRDMGIGWGIVLFVFGCCSITVNFWLDMSYGSKLYNELTLVDGNIDYGAMNRTSKQKTLSRLFLFAFPCFPATHIAANIQLLTREQVFIAYGLCSLIAKLLFAGSVSDAHIGLAGGIQNLKLVTEKALNHTRRQFLRYVFHEVRVPLNTITMGLMVLKEEESVLCEASKEALDMMGGATNFMSDTLNDCLSLQRIEDSKMTIVKKRFTMGALIKGATLAVKGNADAKDIVIQVESTLELYNDHTASAGNSPLRNNTIDTATIAAAASIKRDKFYIGDQFRLEHVIMNFLSNAIKFSPVGATVKIVISGVDRKIQNPLRKLASVGRKPRSFLSLLSLVSNSKSSRVGRTPGDGASNLPEMVDICDVTVLVKDSGAGISKQDQEQLFQMYSQIQADILQQGKGSGLGLVLAKEIINLHGGTVIFESEEGKGSSFGFCIPFEVQSSTAQTAGHGPSASEQNGRGQEFDPNSLPDSPNAESPRNPSSAKGSASDEIMVHHPQSGMARELEAGDSKGGDVTRSASRAQKSNSNGGNRGNSGKEDDVDANDHAQSRNIHSTPHNHHHESKKKKNLKKVAPGTKFLIVDDTESNRKMLAMVLRGYGIECEFGQDGQEALDKVKSKPTMDYYSLIFMDSIMPIMTGLDATKAIRSLGYNNLILGLTGNALEQDRDEFLACGCDCVFPKPIRQIHIDAILHHIDKHGFKSTVGKKYLVDGDTHAVHMSPTVEQRKADQTASH